MWDDDLCKGACVKEKEKVGEEGGRERERQEREREVKLHVHTCDTVFMLIDFFFNFHMFSRKGYHVYTLRCIILALY